MFIYPYMKGSASVKSLNTALKSKIIKLEGSKFKPSANKTLINWGSSSLPAEYSVCKVINRPESVAICSNKLTFFNHMSSSDVRIPDFTDQADEVLTDNYDRSPSKVTWVSRGKLQGHSAEGLELIHGGEQDIPEAKLYVRYVPKKQEYRVHVFDGEVLDVQRKARNTEVPDDQVNWQVRNHQNGFIFARNEDHTPPQDVLDQSVKAVNHCGLDFGAVDVIWNDKESQAYVLEINTAPGLTGSTLESYVNAIREKVKFSV